MANGERNEKEEKGRDESWEEKWRRDPLSAVVWAAILIWAGLVLLAENLELLVRYERLEAWSLIFAGAGLIVLVEVAVRLILPDYRRPVGGTLIFAAILLGIGLGSLINFAIVGALVLIAIGAGLLLRGFTSDR